MPTKEAALKSRLVHLAKSYPKGSDERKKLLQVITGADFDPSEIGEVVPGALEEGTPEETYQGDQFTQQEFSELGVKQEKGELGMKVDDTEAKLPLGQQEEGRLASDKDLFDSLVRLAKDDAATRGPILAALREAGFITADGKVATDKFGGCEKLPEGGMRDNCEKKKEEGKGKDDDKDDKDDFLKKKDDDKKASRLPTQNSTVRALAIRLAKSNEAIRPKVINVVLAHDKAAGVDHAQMLNARKVEAAGKGAKTAMDAAKAVTKKALELGYDKAAAVAAGKKAHASFAA